MFPLYHSDYARARGFRESRALRQLTGGVKGSLIVVSGAILIDIYIYIYVHRCTTSKNSQGLKGNYMEKTCQEAPLAMIFGDQNLLS